MTAKPVCVLVAARRGPEALLRALRALDAQTLSPDQFEVVVCLDAAAVGGAGGVEACEAAIGQTPVRYALSSLRSERPGLAAGFNRALARTAAPVLVLTTDDITLAPESLTYHLTLHVRTQGQKLSFSGRLLPAETVRRDLFTAWVFAGAALAPFGYLGETRGVTDFRLCVIGNVSVARPALVAAGAFDEDFEDGGVGIDLGWRLERLGYQVFYESLIKGFDHRLHTPAGLADACRLQGAEDGRLFLKHPGLVGRYLVDRLKGFAALADRAGLPLAVATQTAKVESLLCQALARHDDHHYRHLDGALAEASALATLAAQEGMARTAGLDARLPRG